MSALVLLIPVALGLGLLGLAAFLWALKDGQFDDPDGAAARILDDSDVAGPAKTAAKMPAKSSGKSVRTKSV